MDDCAFCVIDPTKNRVAYDGDLVMVMFSNPRLMKGHLLVIPKRHVEKPWELTEAEHKEIFGFVHNLQRKLSSTLGSGCDIRQNYRPFAKQSRLKVDHVHYHLLPRRLHDELYERSMQYETAMFAELPEGEVAEVMGILAKDN